MRALFPALPLLLATTLPGQGISWDIPHRGAITYKRTLLAQETRIPEGRLRTVELIPTAEAGGHEWRYLVRENTLRLEPGHTFSDEPGIYILGEFGVRLEDCMYITEDGARLFTPPSPSLDDPFGNWPQ